MILETVSIISFATWLGSKIADKGFDSIHSKLTSDNKFDTKFNECIKKTTSKLEEKYPDILGNSIHYFFTQEEVFDELCKLLFINQELNIEIISETFHEASLPKDFILEFLQNFKNNLSLEPEFQELLANKELFIAVKGISKDIKELSNNSTLTLTEIKEIKQILQNRFKSKFSLNSFLTLYSKNLVNNLGTLNFIGLGIDPSIKKGKRKELEKIFVKPLFEIRSKYHLNFEKNNNTNYHCVTNNFGTNDSTLISYDHLFDRPYNFVILGNPGAGKSLLIKSIVCDIARQAKQQFSNKKIFSYIPFRIELKNYLPYKKKKGGNLLKYLSYSLEEEYSVPSILEENLSHILKYEKVIIFFDGLDEIFNASDKLSVKNDIENFHNLFPKVRSITTSRFIGYNEVKLNENNFCELAINSFNQEQIEEYVGKWYELEEEDIDVRNIETRDFISKMNNIDNELLSNPLLLSLIVILYRNNLKIPESKLEIYQSCTNTLVDKWDASKNLDIKLNSSILQKKEPILSDLAFWQYESLSSKKNNNITYHLARKTVAESLVRKKVADEFNSENLAETFLDYAQKRSIYFDNNFTHKTFLEYYSAYWIYTNIEKKHNILERDKIIKKYISNPFWFIVLELLLNMIDKDQPDTEIIDSIFEKQAKNINSLSFLIYILPNINNISTETTLHIYELTLLHLVTKSRILQKQKDLFSKIVKNVSNNKQMEYLINAVAKIPRSKRNANFYILIHEIVLSPRNIHIKNKILESIIDENYKSILKENPYLYIMDFGYRHQNEEEKVNNTFLETTINFINYFGQSDLFKQYSSKFDSFGYGEFYGFFLFIQLKEKNIYTIRENFRILNEHSVSDLSVLKYLSRHGLYYHSTINSLNYLIDLISNENTSDKEKLFLTIILRQGIANGHVISRNKITLSQLNINNKLKSLIKRINKINSLKSINEITQELNLKDIEVVKLLKSINTKS